MTFPASKVGVAKIRYFSSHRILGFLKFVILYIVISIPIFAFGQYRMKNAYVFEFLLYETHGDCGPLESDIVIPSDNFFKLKGLIDQSSCIDSSNFLAFLIIRGGGLNYSYTPTFLNSIKHLSYGGNSNSNYDSLINWYGQTYLNSHYSRKVLKQHYRFPSQKARKFKKQIWNGELEVRLFECDLEYFLCDSEPGLVKSRINCIANPCQVALKVNCTNIRKLKRKEMKAVRRKIEDLLNPLLSKKQL